MMGLKSMVFVASQNNQELLKMCAALLKIHAASKDPMRSYFSERLSNFVG